METKKIKYIDMSQNQLYNNPQFWNYNKKSDVIDEENFLKLPVPQSKKKTQIMLKKDMHPNNYCISYENTHDDKEDNFVSYYGTDFGPGRGIGNLDSSNILRYGESTRLENKNFKKYNETIKNNRFEFLDRNVQNPDNIVLPFPRGGENTRSKSNLTFNTLNRKNKRTTHEFKY